MKIRFYFESSTFLFLALFTFGWMMPTAQAQPYPNRPLQLIIPSAPGTPSDITARLFSEEMSRTLGTQIIPINKPGASMTLGTDQVVRSKKDGYTIGYTTTSAIVYTRVTNPETVPYNPDRDLEPLGLTVFFPISVNVLAKSPWKSFGELIDYAKKNPEKLRISTHGVGGIDHFNVEVIQSLTGARFTFVPVKGGPQLATALLGGHVEVTLDAVSNVLSHIGSGEIRVLLLTKKMSGLPNVPTVAELGYSQDLFLSWFAFFAPAGIPEEAKKVLVAAVEKAVRNPEIKDKLEKLGFIVDHKSPAELRKIMVEDYDRACGVAVKMGLRK